MKTFRAVSAKDVLSLWLAVNKLPHGVTALRLNPDSQPLHKGHQLYHLFQYHNACVNMAYVADMMDRVVKYPLSYIDVLVFPDVNEFWKLQPHDMTMLRTCAHCRVALDLAPKPRS